MTSRREKNPSRKNPTIWVFQIKLSFCLDVNVANFSKIMARTVVTTSWCWKYWKDYFKARPVAMMKPRDQVSFWTLIEAYFKKTEKKKRERISYPHKIKKNWKRFPNFWWEIQLFQLASNFFDTEPETMQKGEKGDFVLDHRWDKNIWRKGVKRKKLINHYF